MIELRQRRVLEPPVCSKKRKKAPVASSKSTGDGVFCYPQSFFNNGILQKIEAWDNRHTTTVFAWSSSRRTRKRNMWSENSLKYSIERK